MAAVNWCIAFPYCPNEPIRAEAFELVREFYDKHFPNVPQLVHSATIIGEPFLRSKTRNELVNMAATFDIVVLIDADTLVEPAALRRMVDMALERDMFLGKPFFRGINLNLNEQRQLANGDIPWPRGRFNDPGAAWVIRPSSWRAAGGMDESFLGWGGEDEAFLYLFAALGGETVHGELPAVKTEHEQPRWRKDPHWSNTIRRELVTRAIWEHAPHLAAEWLKVRHEPGALDEWARRLNVTVPRRHQVRAENR